MGLPIFIFVIGSGLFTPVRSHWFKIQTEKFRPTEHLCYLAPVTPVTPVRTPHLDPHNTKKYQQVQ